jgi:hypothetical protein
MLAFPALSAMAQLPTSLTVSTNNTPLDRKALPSCGRSLPSALGVGFKLVSLPSERSLLAANQGEVDGEGLRVAGLEETTPTWCACPNASSASASWPSQGTPAISAAQGLGQPEAAPRGLHQRLEDVRSQRHGRAHR